LDQPPVFRRRSPRDPGPQPQRRLIGLVKLDPTRAVSVAALDLRVVAEALEAEERTPLELTSTGRTTDRDDRAARLVEVAADVRGEATRRKDLAVEVIACLCGEPGRRMMRQQERELVLLDPCRTVTVAGAVKLADVDRELAEVVAAGDLEKARVEAEEAEADAVLGDRRGEVPGDDPAAELGRRGEGGAVEPGVVVGEDLIDEAALRRVRVAPKVVLHRGVLRPTLEDQHLRLERVGADQIVVAGHREEHGLGAERLDVLPERAERLVEAIKLLGAAALGDVSGEEDQVPRAATIVQLGQILKEDVLDPRPQPRLGVEALVEIREVKPAKRAHGGRRSG